MLSHLTEAERIIKAKIDLQASNPFFAYILLNFDIRPEDGTKGDVPTMAVDKYGHLYWNQDFVKTLSDAELAAVLCHEAMHVATLTFPRQGSRDMNLWNIATDLIINTLLKSDGMSLPADVILPNNKDCWEMTGKDKKKFKLEKVSEKTAEEIYDFIINHAEVIKESLNMDGDGNYDGAIDKHLKGNAGSGEDDKDSEESSNANTERWKQAAVEAATQAKMRGKSKAWMDRMIDGILNPQINWKAKLQQFITRDLPVDYTMRRPGRRYYSTGIYYPSIIRENLEIVIAIDTSGSISDEEYKMFLSEVLGICKGFEQINARIIFWSTEITDDLNVNKSESDMLINYKFGSTGGTTMSCVAEYVRDKGINSQLYIFFTDGCTEPNPKVPDGNKLFVLSKNGTDEIVKKYGPVCKLK